MSRDVVAQINTLAARDDHPKYTWCRAPFSVTVGRSTWSVGTDRRWLVAIRGPSTLPRVEATGHVDWLTRLLTFEPPAGAAEVDIGALTTWAGEAPAFDDTFPMEDQREGAVFSIALDRKRLARVLSIAPTVQKIVVWDATSAAGIPLLGLCVGKDWKAYLAGLDMPVHEVHDRFNFPVRQEPTAIELMAELAQE